MPTFHGLVNGIAVVEDVIPEPLEQQRARLSRLKSWSQDFSAEQAALTLITPLLSGASPNGNEHTCSRYSAAASSAPSSGR